VWLRLSWTACDLDLHLIHEGRTHLVGRGERVRLRLSRAAAALCGDGGS
jgi:hypothetical protein